MLSPYPSVSIYLFPAPKTARVSSRLARNILNTYFWEGDIATQILGPDQLPQPSRVQWLLEWKGRNWREGFPGGSLVKNSPANAGDMGLVPDPGRSHMPWSNWAHEP